MRWNPALSGLSAYRVADARGLIKLDAMENPYPLPAEVGQAFAEQLAGLPSNRYPDPAATELKAAIAAEFPVGPGFELVLGNGSDELITILLQAALGSGAPILAAEPCFVMYRHLARIHGLPFVGVPLRADFSLDVPALLTAIEQQQPALVFIASPNNPTGNAFAADDIATLADASPGLLVLDEAYIPYAGHDGAALAAEKPNIVLLRTLSKWGLAGLRLGFIQARAAHCAQFEKLRLPYNINVLSQTLGTLCLRHRACFSRQIATLVAGRARLAEGLATAGVQVFPSQANFLLLRVADADGVHQRLRDGGVLVKNLHGSHPLLEQCLRISVGTPEENEKLLALWPRVL